MYRFGEVNDRGRWILTGDRRRARRFQLRCNRRTPGINRGQHAREATDQHRTAPLELAIRCVRLSGNVPRVGVAFHQVCRAGDVFGGRCHPAGEVAGSGDVLGRKDPA